ncbi:SDR family oxidoreductase [Kaistia dalseonensis]|uniref:NAD(P)-dependent dehydrogenase (Short-subunit alcohol dehydrogenase family) n=1 Tax=Kaistia dalseonensis TaxID=410840 RepID=A0ABU0HAN4_9HYPH|nr:SDR family oxidoreductase [Kaistia dalseonensis]MCX5496217.1 SDR family oxidoreductase [Kaistia dalseonensis]MDQ0438835.1 NAD(P)-dependent dehydrogenase (short-subunit alcohol dehydrogenase family) [Kaistia dalseonensis]
MEKSLNGRTVLVTGANGGLGEQFVIQALERGATKVYAAARKPRHWENSRVQALALDITDPDSISRAAAQATDVDLLINNAAIAPAGDSMSGPEAELRRIFETNFFGTLRVANAFVPILANHGGGTILNVLSTAAWIGLSTGYSVSKAAMWSATNGLRFQLQAQNTQVIGLLVGMIDTPMSSRWDFPKVSAASVVAQAYDGVSDGAMEVLADEPTRNLKSMLSMKGEELYPMLHEQLASFKP